MRSPPLLLPPQEEPVDNKKRKDELRPVDTDRTFRNSTNSSAQLSSNMRKVSWGNIGGTYGRFPLAPVG